MYEQYEERGLSVIAFPCNQFNEQEPGTNEEIKEHVTEKYGITFDMMSKIEVNGAGRHEIYSWLVDSDVGEGRDIEWNFTCFVINRCGQIQSRHATAEHPETWEDEILELLNEEPGLCSSTGVLLANINLIFALSVLWAQF